MLRRHRRRAVLQGQSAVVGRDAGGRVRGGDVVQRLEEAAAEVADAGEPLPELLMHGIPGDELRPAGGYTV